MKKILILAMMTLLFAVTALSTTAGNFFWVTSTFGTPTSLFGNSGGNDDPNPNVNPPFPPTSGDPTDWAVFATEGKYSLTGGAFIKPKNEISPSGYIGTNASSLVEGIKPVDFGGSEDSVILPPVRFYFGPGATPSLLVAGGNLGEKSKTQIADFKANSKVLKTTKTFFDPKAMNLTFPDNPVFPVFPGLVYRGAKQTQWDPLITKITITESGYYPSIKTIGEDHSLEFVVGAQDLVVVAGTLETKGNITVTRNGNGDFFLFVLNSAMIDTNLKTFDIDVGSANTVLDFGTLTLQNKLVVRNVLDSGSFSLNSDTATITNSVSSLMTNSKDMILRFGSLTMNGITAWTIERVGEKTGEVFAFVDSALTLSSDTKLLAKDWSDEFIHLIYKGSPANFSLIQFQLNGSIYALNAVDIIVSGSSSVKNLVTKGDITVSGAGTAANSVYTPEGSVTITGSGNLKNGAMAGGNTVILNGGITPPKYIWAPNAQVSLQGSASVEGRVIGKNISLSGNVKILYEMVDYELPEIPEPNRYIITPPYPSVEWGIFCRDGFDSQANAHEITGNVLVLRSKEVGKQYHKQNDPVFVNEDGMYAFKNKNIDGSLTVGEVTSGTLSSDLIGQFNSVAIGFFTPPFCEIPTGSTVFSSESAGSLTINANYSGIYAPNAKQIILKNHKISGNIYAPNAELQVQTNGIINGKIFVRFLSVQANVTINAQ